MADGRYPLSERRELRIARLRHLFVVTIHDLARDGICTTGPLALREEDLGVLQMAIAQLAIDDEEA